MRRTRSGFLRSDLASRTVSVTDAVFGLPRTPAGCYRSRRSLIIWGMSDQRSQRPFEQSHNQETVSREGDMARRLIATFGLGLAAPSIAAVALGAQLMTTASATPLSAAIPLSAAGVDNVVRVHCIRGNVRCRSPYRQVCVVTHFYCPANKCHRWGCKKKH